MIQFILKETCIIFEKTLTIRLLGEIKVGLKKLWKEPVFLAMVSSFMEQNLQDAKDNQS